MSGGVDSSVSAALLKEQGYRVIGLFMKNWNDADTVSSDCSSETDFRDVERVCRTLDIPNYTVELIDAYRERVFARFLRDYEAGLTPNPDILCNREIKFDAFYERALEFGADLIATGHYCRTDAARTRLLKGLDPNKDQTYFLSAIDGTKLSRVLFPVGDVPKPEVRALAERLSLSTHDKKDSTGICFIGEKKFRAFLGQYLRPKPGAFETLDGRRVGTHTGAQFYTLGQRKGLGLGGEGERWFVVAKDATRNRVIVERGEFHPALYTDELWADELNFIADFGAEIDAAGEGGVSISAKVRYRQREQACVIRRSANGEAHLVFSEPQRAVTPGQAVVFYRGDECLGGGTIRRTGENYWSRGATLEEMRGRLETAPSLTV